MKIMTKIFAMVLSIGVLILIGIVTQSFFSETDYSTYGAVTYFDDSGQYQLINSVAEDYVIYNAKEEKFISGFVLYYIQKEEKIYMITNPNKKEIAYAILDIKNNTFIEHKDIKSFDYSAQKILTDTDAMVNLTKKHSQELKNILKFLPQKWRKW